MYKVRVWDLPTRVFHWCLVLTFIGLVVTGQIAGEAMVWHFRLGYALLSLILFRVIWGFVGGHWSRFSQFVRGPVAVFRYLRGGSVSAHAPGHNPLGAWSVLALLALPLLQVATGLISDDEIATSGPMARFVPSSWVGNASFYHTEVGKPLLIALVVLHVAAIVFYRLKKRKDLISPMLHGDCTSSDPFESSQDNARSRGLAVAVFLLCAGVVAGFVALTA